MTIWWEGVFKIRGTRENVLFYLKELLADPMTEQNIIENSQSIEFRNDIVSVNFSLKDSSCKNFYLKGTGQKFSLNNFQDEKHNISPTDLEKIQGELDRRLQKELSNKLKKIEKYRQQREMEP